VVAAAAKVIGATAGAGSVVELDGVELDGVGVGVLVGSALGVGVAVAVLVVAVVATGVGVGVAVVSAVAGPATAASDRPAVRATAATAASTLLIMFGFSLGEGFFGYAPKGNVRRRGGRRQVAGGTTMLDNRVGSPTG
jgi:hypothetical protein